MKVTLTEGYRNIYTLSDLDRAKAVIACEKEDESTPASYAEYAVREALKGTDDGLVRVIEASAETGMNRRAMDSYGTGTGNMDIWIRATAKTYDGFIEIGAYLTDIWQTGSDYDYKSHMWIKRYLEEDKDDFYVQL